MVSFKNDDTGWFFMKRWMGFGLAILLLTGCGAGPAADQAQELDGTGQTETQELGTWDLDRDGALQMVLLEDSGTGEVWTLTVRKGEDTLWSETAGTPHMGWNSLLVLRLDGQDCLLRYQPWMGQGCAAYQYSVFVLDENGGEVPLRENSVAFDVNFGSPLHEDFDPAEIAAFLSEVHSLLNASTLLLSTEGGQFRSGGSGANFREDFQFWDEDCPYDEAGTLQENLKRYEVFWQSAMTDVPESLLA